MPRKPWLRRLPYIFMLAVGPLSVGCEAILDFDRTPLQPIPDAGTTDDDDDTAPGKDAGKKDAKAGGDDDDDQPDARADSGKDAGDGGDAGDAGGHP